jgi:hypothetical protein
MRFTIRDLLWLTVVVALGVAMGVGWWFDRAMAWARAYELNLKLEMAEHELEQWKAAHAALMPKPEAPAPNPPKN